MGISVGWGDAYLPSYDFQAIDITGLPSGDYRLCATVNPQNLWHEKSAANDSYWLDLHLRPAVAKLKVIGQGATPC
jgi:hypothetical protein